MALLDLAPPTKIWLTIGADERRVLALAGVSAIVGLIIAGFGLFTAQGTRVGGVPAEDAATVNGVPILMVDYIGQLRTLYDKSLDQATPRERKQALDDMIREELYVQRGVELGMAGDEITVREALASANNSQVAADAMNATPAERALKAWFDAHRARYAIDAVIDATDYLVPPEKAAQAPTLTDALQHGSGPDALGLRDAGTFASGPQFAAVVRSRLGGALYRAAISLPDGGVSAPVLKPDGTHILILHRRIAQQPETFAEAMPKVIEDWTTDRIAHLSQENDRRLRRQADVRIAKALQ